MTASPASAGSRSAMGGRASALAVQAGVITIALVVSLLVMGPAQFMNALTLGAIYALVALGYTMVYGIIELINFAHGDVFMVGAFVSLSLLTTLGFTGAVSDVPTLVAVLAIVFLVSMVFMVGAFVSLSLLTTLGFTGAISDMPTLVAVLAIVFLVSMVFMGLVGVVIERFAYRPLRNAPRLAPLLTAIGVSFILQNVIQLMYGPFQINYPQIFPTDWFIEVGGTKISVLSMFIIGLAVSLMVGLQLFVGRTRLGRAMRSTALDREAAALMGVNINRTIAITFLIGSALAGAAGVVQGLYYGVAQFQLGFFAGLKAFTAAVLGGIGNTVGAALGGFIIGFIEVGASSFGYARWGPAIVFAILVLVLVFRPSGLLGQQLGERA